MFHKKFDLTRFDLSTIINSRTRSAIGLAISGREIRLATLCSEKGRVSVQALEIVYLDSSLEYQALSEEKEFHDNTPHNDTKDAFGLKDGWEEKASENTGALPGGANLEILYKFLFKHISKRTKVGLNIPVSMAKYQRIDSSDFKQADDLLDNSSRADKDAGLGSEQHLLKLADGATVSLVHDQYPPFLNILREVNDFLGKKMHFGTMDATELALASMARAGHTSHPGHNTVIVYIEDDFTRLIFMNGHELMHVSSIINENAASPQVLDVISRRLMYEIDEAKIPEINSILLAGRCSNMPAKAFFTRHYKKAKVDYLFSSALGPLPVEMKKQKEVFSEFAVAIALAWKQLQPKNPDFYQLNLIPQNLRDQQEIIKLDRVGYGLLGLTGMVAFLVTFQIISLRSDIHSMEMKVETLEQEIRHARNEVDDVLDLEGESKKLESNLSLVDDLAKEHDSFLVFLKKLNRSIQGTGEVWVNQITKNGSTYSLNGYSQSRLKIPILADKLGGAILNKVTRERNGASSVYHFSMDNIQFDRDAEPDPEGMSLANFTTIPNFTNEYFAGSSRAIPEAASPPSTVQNNVRQPVTSSRQRSAPPPKKTTHLTQKIANGAASARTNGHASSSKSTASNGAANHGAAQNETGDRVSQITARQAAERAKVPYQKNNETSEPSYPAKRYFIQLIQTENLDYAEKYVVVCRNKGLRASISRYFDRSRGQDSFRVLLGNYPSQENAQKAHALLSEALGASAMRNTRIIALDMPANN